MFLKKRTTVIHPQTHSVLFSPGNHAGCVISPKADRNSRRLKLSITEISDHTPLFWHSYVIGYFKVYKEINYKLLIFVTFTAICFFLQTLLQKKKNPVLPYHKVYSTLIARYLSRFKFPV